MSKPVPEGWVDLRGKLYPTWPVVLNAAHRKGLVGIETELLQIPDKENGNVAIVRCTANFIIAVDGHHSFSALGDASPANVGAFLVPALIRMAETRAKGRALRDACNVGQTLLEEIGPDNEDAPLARQEAPTQQRARYDPGDQTTRLPAPGGPDKAFQEDYARERAERQSSGVTCTAGGCGAVLSPKETEGSRRRWPDQGEVCLVHAMARRLTEQQEAGAARIGAAA